MDRAVWQRRRVRRRRQRRFSFIGLLHPRRVRRALLTSWEEWRLWKEALIWLGVCRLAVLLLPFRWIAPYLGRAMVESPYEETPATQAQVQHISSAIHIMSRYTPWNSNCLAQAIAARVLLRRRGLLGTLYLGVNHDANHALQAHAWVRSGTVIVTGAPEHQHYTVVALFT
jgi:hypothetical protein